MLQMQLWPWTASHSGWTVDSVFLSEELYYTWHSNETGHKEASSHATEANWDDLDPKDM